MDVRGQFHASAYFFLEEEATYSILVGWAYFHIFTKIHVFWDVTLRHWEVGLDDSKVHGRCWMQHVPSKWQKAFNHQRDVTSHKIEILEKSSDVREIELRSSNPLGTSHSRSALWLRVHQVAESFMLSAITESWPSHWVIPAHCYYWESLSQSCSVLLLRADEVTWVIPAKYFYWEFTKSLSHSCSVLLLRAHQDTESFLLSTISESSPSHWVIPAH